MNRPLALCLLLSIAAHLLLSVSYGQRPEEQVLVSVELREQSPESRKQTGNLNHPGSRIPLTASRIPDRPLAAPESAPVLGSALGLATNYPKLSRILREEGEVLIRLSDLAVLQSSGHPRLDESARASVREGLDKGILKPGDTQIRFIFKLRGTLDR